MAIDRSHPRARTAAPARGVSRPRHGWPGAREAASGGLAPEPAVSPLSSLSIECEAHEDLVLVALEGELDIYTTPAFRQQVRRHDPVERPLVIDLTAVSLLDSAGLGELMSLRNEADRGGARLGLVCPRHRLTRLFRITGLRSAFAFGHDLATVRAALAAPRRGRAICR
jgi:anti-sigma B factor antagonist